jgi:hypothetical protein
VKFAFLIYLFFHVQKTVSLLGRRLRASLVDSDDIALSISSSKLESSVIQKVVLAIKQSELGKDSVELLPYRVHVK